MSNPAADHADDGQAAVPGVPDFDLLRSIGRGGFGEVWLARNQATGQLRAVKLIALSRPGTTDPAGREVASITRLEENVKTQHPNLLAIHHVGKTQEHLFYVTDPADDATGVPASNDPSYRPATLAERLKTGPLPPDECRQCAEQLLTGLAHLHAAGMVHRDVKPANCLFVDGQLKLADFGLLAEATPLVSRVGTEKYMPPDGRMDTRADVYAAGLVIYEMMTGRPVENFPRLGEQARAIADDPILQRLNHLVLRACQPKAKDRYEDARAMLAAWQKPPKRRARPTRRVLIASIAAMLVVVAAVVAGIWWGGPKSAPAPDRVDVSFITEPFEATVFIDGKLQKHPDGTDYTTPCTITNLPTGVHRVRFEHPERPALEAGEFDFGETREIEVSWGR